MTSGFPSGGARRHTGRVHTERRSRLPGAQLWSQPAGAAHEGLVLPDGCVDLLWRTGPHGGELLVAGPDTTAHAVSTPAGTAWTGLRLPPGAAPALLGVPASALRDARVPLAELWPAARVRVLGERVAAAADTGRALEAVLAERAAGLGAAAADPLPRRAAALLGRGHPVADVADRLGVGVRRLHRLSLAAFGYGPKVLARVLRLQAALRAARTGLPAAEVAALAGYADQQHLAREVRALTGTTLTRLLRG